MTDKEKACLIYGFARGLAVAAKDQGLFKDWKIEEIIREFLKEDALIKKTSKI